MTSSNDTAAPKPWLFMFIVLAAIWGSSFLFMRLSATEFGIFPTSCLRMGIGAAAMLPLLWWRDLLPQMLANWRRILWISFINAVLPFVCFAFAVLHISTGLSAILNATAPMFSALVAWAWLGQRLTTWRVVGIAIGFMGVALLAGEQAALKGDALWLSILAMLACLTAALCYGLSGNMIKEQLSHLHPWVIACGTMIGATLWLAVPTVLTWPSVPPSTQAWGALITVGVVCSAIAFMMYFTLLQRVDATKAQSVTYLIPVFAFIYGSLFLAERLTPWVALCGAVVLMGTALATGLVRKSPSVTL